jgi:cyanophycin synthetase
MKIHSIRTLAGPNIFSHRPMLAMELDLGALYACESRDYPVFIDRLLKRLPGVHDHHCATGKPGGFVRRLREGTYFGHIVEHVALELTDAAGISTNRGKTIATDIPGRYLVAVEYKSERGMAYLLETAVQLVEALLSGQPYDLDARLEAARAIVAESELGPSTRAITDAADRRGIPWRRVNDQSRVRLGLGSASRYVDATITDGTSSIAVDLAGDKHETKRVLADVGLPAPVGGIATTRDEAAAYFRSVAPPVVVKPLDGNQGRGVSLNLKTEAEVLEAFEIASQVSRRVIIEEMYRGNDYRVVLVDGKLVAAAQRIPAHVWGDGTRTIGELIDAANADPRRGNDHEKPMTKIKTDPLVLAVLKRAGRSLSQVPEAGEIVQLRDSANLSTGGEARDVTDTVHPTVRELCERTARTIGLDVCGVDLVLPDISVPFSAGGIVEVNAAPGIRMHHYPSEGVARDVGGSIVDMLYPPGKPTRIPIASITGTNGKTTVTRMIAHALRRTGKTVGMTTTDGIWIADAQVACGDLTGPWSANVVLGDRAVDVAVLETARGGIMRSGLGYDWADVAVITNIQPDHFGQDGIQELGDIATVKRLVAERVREGGTLILNADDEQVAAMAAHPRVAAVKKDIIFFSLDPANPIVEAHLAAGGTAYVLDGDRIESRANGTHRRFAQASRLPSTLNGTATFQVSNILAAAAAAGALGVPRHAVAEAMGTFHPNEHSSGRSNVFAFNGAYGVVDYGHNPAAIRALCDTVAQWGASRITVVLGVPGDRRNELLQESARAVTRADRVIVREDGNTRGRERGEVASLLLATLRNDRPDTPVSVVLDENEAVHAAMVSARPGEVVLMFIDDLDSVTEQMATLGARRVMSFERLEAVSPAAQPAA